MKLEVKFSYQEGYLPTKRHRKLRYREAEGVTVVNVNQVSEDDAPIAFLVHSSLMDNPTEYRFWQNKLWRPVLWNEKYSGKEGLYPLEEFLKSIEYHSSYKRDKTKEVSEKEKHDYVSRHLIIDGVVCCETSEPRYVLMTFGLGNNHGGTSLMTTNYYNSNISKDRYFNALQEKEAIEEAKRIAHARGDTKSIEMIGESCKIEVLMPEIVRCNPKDEHGDGDPFLNKLYGITETPLNNNEKAMLGTVLLANELEKGD